MLPGAITSLNKYILGQKTLVMALLETVRAIYQWVSGHLGLFIANGRLSIEDESANLLYILGYVGKLVRTYSYRRSCLSEVMKNSAVVLIYSKTLDAWLIFGVEDNFKVFDSIEQNLLHPNFSSS